MRVDFYQLGRDPVERVVPLLVAKALDRGARLLVVSGDTAQRTGLSQALWERENDFLAHAEAGDRDEARQPVLIAADCSAANGARMVLIADGQWRESAAMFERAILLFGAGQTGEARQEWTTLSGAGHELRIFKQHEDGSWREGR